MSTPRHCAASRTCGHRAGLGRAPAGAVQPGRTSPSICWMRIWTRASSSAS